MKRQTGYPQLTTEPLVLNDALALPAGPPAMVRTQIYLSRVEYDFVQAQATQRNEPMAAVIRAFIDEKMQLPSDAWTSNPMLEPTPHDPALNLPEDAAINHDHYLYGTAKKYVKARGQWVLAEEAGKPRR
ncbi:MAG: hypothetical protein ABMA26_17005 [Limisphaerales bacterium]